MARDPELLAHQEWLGYLQPVGLVVSPPALVAAQAFPTKNIIPDHSRFLDLVERGHRRGRGRPSARDPRLPALRHAGPRLGAGDLIGTAEASPSPTSLEVTLTEYHETLRPTYAVPEFDKDPDGDRKWLMLIQRVKLGLDLDDAAETDQGPPLAGQPAGPVRAAAARDPGADRPALQRHAPAAGLRPARRDVGAPDLPRRRR